MAQNIEFYLLAAFLRQDIMSIDSESVDSEQDANKIVFLLKSNFGVDFEWMLKEYASASEQIKINTIHFLKARYNENAEFSK